MVFKGSWRKLTFCWAISISTLFAVCHSSVFRYQCFIGVDAIMYIGSLIPMDPSSLG